MTTKNRFAALREASRAMRAFGVSPEVAARNFGTLRTLDDLMTGRIPVFKSLLAPSVDGEGNRVVAIRVVDRILVHPDRWDEFQMRINQPDVADALYGEGGLMLLSE